MIFWPYANISDTHTAVIFSPEDGGLMFLQNVGGIQPKYPILQQL
jgi:hypothetical protein